MSNWIRRVDIEESFQELHGIKPVVYSQAVSNLIHKTKLQLAEKEIILQEILEKGVTKLETLEYNGEVTKFSSVYDAEKAAVEILRS
jgi:hypothetical protein